MDTEYKSILEKEEKLLSGFSDSFRDLYKEHNGLAHQIFNFIAQGGDPLGAISHLVTQNDALMKQNIKLMQHAAFYS